jgi:sulfate adenylyltransferase
MLLTFMATTALQAAAPTHQLTPVEKYDLQMLRFGAFAPVTTFHNEDDYNSILERGKLADGQLWPIPIVLTLNETEAKNALEAKEIVLTDEYGTVLAQMSVESVYKPRPKEECQAIYGTTDTNHPFIQSILEREDKWYASGALEYKGEMNLPEECIAPALIREEVARLSKVVGFQTRNPLHKSHFHLTMRALEEAEGDLLLLTPVIGPTQPGDINAATRTKCYKALLNYYPEHKVKLCLIPLAMRMAGPKEALLHALIRKNYGCTHFIVGRDHAGPSVKKSDGSSFYKPYEAQEYLAKLENELGMKIVKSEELVYIKEDQTYIPVSQVKEGQTPASISGTELRRLLRTKGEMPEWFSFPEVVSILQKDYETQGTCLYLVGLSGAGKTTLAHAIKEPLETLTGRKVVIIDADLARKRLYPELGFSPEARSLNVRRIGMLASMLTETGAICIVANCAPYEADRKANRALVSEFGTYVEVFLNTPVEACMQRDPKKIYEKFQRGEVKNVLGLDLPFEAPQKPELVIDGSMPLAELKEQLLSKLMTQFF